MLFLNLNVLLHNIHRDPVRGGSGKFSPSGIWELNKENIKKNIQSLTIILQPPWPQNPNGASGAASEYLSKVVSIPTLMLEKTIGIIVLHTCNKCQVWKTNK